MRAKGELSGFVVVVYDPQLELNKLECLLLLSSSMVVPFKPQDSLCLSLCLPVPSVLSSTGRLLIQFRSLENRQVVELMLMVASIWFD